MTTKLEPYDPRCKRYASDIPDVVMFAQQEEMDPAEWIRREEGTYNPSNEHFLCDECYIASGCPTAPWPGWKCP